MNLKDIRNNVHRSGFDMSFRNCFTAKVGEILPVSSDVVLPGDKWNVNLRQFMRTAPVQTASFGRVRQYYDWYFVPFRLLWDKFPAWIVQTKNAYHAQDLLNPVQDFSSLPYFISSDLHTLLTRWDNPSNLTVLDGNVSRIYGALKLLNYLGYGANKDIIFPDSESEYVNFAVHMNPFPLAAYQKIYQDYFRFPQWEDAAPWTYNFDYIMNDSQLRVNISQYGMKPAVKTLFDLQFCNYDKDLFNGLLPSPQYGDEAIAAPLGPVRIPAGLKFDMNMYTVAEQEGVSTKPLTYVPNGYPPYAGIGVQGEDTFHQVRADFVMNSQTDLDVSSQGLSVLLLRQAEALQKWKEITLAGSPDYKEQLARHWNVKVSDAESYRCQYLGGFSSDIDISEVINNNLEADSSRADVHGKGVSAGNGHIEFSSKDFGIIMCVYHAKPLIEWKHSVVWDHAVTSIDALSFPIPEFDNIGMEGVMASQMMDLRPDSESSARAQYTAVVGYAPRYINYKTKLDQINGAFESYLAPWVIPHTIQGQEVTGWAPTLDYRDFKVRPEVCDNMFGLAATSSLDTEQLYCTAYFDAKVVRNLSRDGLPY